MAETLLDAYDAELRHIGAVPWSIVHNTGLWHRTFHCWVFLERPRPSMLLQWRNPDAVNFGGMLDVSAAGHLEAGETVEQGIRELHEELGLTQISIDDLVFGGERVEVADQANGQLNREYQSVYFLKLDIALSDLQPQPSEVYGILRLPLDTGLELFSGEVDSATCDGIVRDERGAYVHTSRRITVDDFLPRIQRYYGAALINGLRLMAGDSYLAIS